jgi:imidazole glycerol-phosphate synthase subunit HisH
MILKNGIESKKVNLIGIIDVGIGNIGSLNSAIYELGFDTCLVNSSVKLAECDSLILPGVGSFSHGMKALKNAGLIEPITTHVSKNKPLLGICLGMQFLFDQGSEGGKQKGLGFISGQVKRFKEDPSFCIPHVGWNEVFQSKQHAVFHGVKTEIDFYFVHSYHVSCNSKYVFAITQHGEIFPSVVSNHNVVGMQFHPEKSQKNGLRMLENFCLWDGVC